MKRSYKSTLIIIGIILLILINLLMFGLGYHAFLYPKLSHFKITALEEDNNFLVLHTSGSNHATKYHVIIKKEQTIIYEKDGDTKDIILTDLRLDYNEEVEITVIATNKTNDHIESDNSYTYQNKEASFNKDIDHYVAESKDMTLYILGYDSNQKYKLELYYNKDKIVESMVTREDVIIPKEKVKGYSGRLTANLVNEKGRLISSFNFYLNSPVVGKIKITSPNNDFTTRWNDITLKYTGGENANHFYISLYQNNVLIKRNEVNHNNHEVIVPAGMLDPNANYQIVLEAIYEDYTEIEQTDEISVHIKSIEETTPVYVSHNPSFIKKGSVITLKSMTDDVVIYYTTDKIDLIRVVRSIMEVFLLMKISQLRLTLLVKIE